MAGNNPTSSNSSVPALISRRPTVLAPPSLSTVNHLDGAISAVNRTSSQSSNPASQDRRNVNSSQSSRTAALSHRTGFQQAVSQATAAVPVSTRENISTSKTWSSGLARKNTNYPIASTSATHHEFAVHPSFRSDADNRGDVLVRVEGVDFFVHKHILLFSSPFFTSILQGDWKESRLSQLLKEEDAQEDARAANEALAEQAADLSTPDDPDATLQDRLANAKVEDIEKALSLTEPVAQGQGAMPYKQKPPSGAGTPIDPLAHDAGESEIDAGQPKDGARRRSVVRASYHTALWSQDEESRSSSTIPEGGVTFADPAEEASSSEEATKLDQEEGSTSGSDSYQDEDSEAERDVSTDSCVEESLTGPSEVQQPAPSQEVQRRRSAVSLRQVRSKSKHLAARLTMRKLEASQKGQSIPTRSASKAAMLTGEPTVASSKASVQTGVAFHVHSHSSPALGPLERLETLATPPISRRPSAEFVRQRAVSEGAFTDFKVNSETVTEPPRVRKLTSRYKDVVAVIDLEEEAAVTFHDFLFHVYPHLDLSVTWWNCGPLLRFSDKFQVPYLRRSCVTFLRASLAGRPIEAMHLAELHSLDDLYKEASRHVLDNFAAWQADELECLSKETLLKLERKRTWFLERLLKLGLANPAWDYECHANCPDPQNCARLLHERWQAAYASALKWGPPQPSVIFRQLRDLDGASFLPLSACQGTARIWVQLLFDRMFGLGALHAERMFLSVKLNGN